MTRQDLENWFDNAMLALSRLAEAAKQSDEMALYYAANRAWHELDAARLKDQAK